MFILKSKSTEEIMRKVVITAAKRTPVGSFNGSLSSFSAAQLGSIAIKGILEDSKIDGNLLMK